VLAVPVEGDGDHVHEAGAHVPVEEEGVEAAQRGAHSPLLVHISYQVKKLAFKNCSVLKTRWHFFVQN